LLLTTGDHDFTLPFAGRERSYILHVPPQVRFEEPLSLIINFHGGGGNAKGYMQYTKMNEFADQAGFAVVYPNGSGERNDKFLSWNAGRCCGYAQEHNIDDVGFVNALLADVPDQLSIDKKRIYATGISNGAMLVYRLASELSDKIAAFAAVAGGTLIDPICARAAVPLMHIHSIDDPRARYQGGLGPHFPMTNIRVDHPDIDNMLNAWIKHNACCEQPMIDATVVGENKSGSSEAHTATRFFYKQNQGKNIVLWKLSGAGHVSPGGLADYLEGFLGASTKVIDANKEIWTFFSEFSLTDT